MYINLYGIFVYNLCLSYISVSFSVRVTKISALNIEHDTNIFRYKFEPDVFNTLNDLGLKTQNFTTNVWAHKRFQLTEKFCSFLKANIFSITRKGLKISLIISFHKFFKHLKPICI